MVTAFSLNTSGKQSRSDNRVRTDELSWSEKFNKRGSADCMDTLGSSYRVFLTWVTDHVSRHRNRLSTSKTAPVQFMTNTTRSVDSHKLQTYLHTSRHSRLSNTIINLSTSRTVRRTEADCTATTRPECKLIFRHCWEAKINVMLWLRVTEKCCTDVFLCFVLHVATSTTEITAKNK